MVPKSGNDPATVEVLHPKTKKGCNGNGSCNDNGKTAGVGDGGTATESFQLRYIPKPHEQSYYESLYRVASQAKTPISPPSIPFSVASQFFSLSRLPIARLRIIWKMADPDDSQTLTKHQFNVAVRLVQLHQNGQRVKDMELNPQQEKVILKPAFFEGVSATKVPLPRKGALKREGSEQTNVSELTFGSFDSPPQLCGGNGRGTGDAGGGKKKDTVVVRTRKVARHSHASMGQAKSQQKPRTTTTSNKTAARVENGASRPSTASTTVKASVAASAQHPLCPYTMRAAEIKSYSAAFAQHREVKDNHCETSGTTPRGNGHVYVPAAVRLFAQSGLDYKQVGSIWNLVLENPAEDRLNKIEFVMMMHIVECATRKGLAVPTALPESLRRWRDGVKRAKESTAVQNAEKVVAEEPVVMAGQECPYSMTSEEADSYGETFKRHRVTTNSQSPPGEIPREEGHIYVPSAIKIFTKAGLDQKLIGSLWDLVVENPNAGRLERMEFILMMHMAVCVAQRGLALPESLPLSLWPWKGGRVLSEMDAVASAANGPLPSARGKVDEPSTVGRACCKSCTSLSKRCADLGVEVWSMRNELEESQTTVRRLRKELVAMRKDIVRNNDVTESATRRLEELEQKMERMRSRPARQLSSKSLHKKLSSRSIRDSAAGSLPSDDSATRVVDCQKRTALHGSQRMSMGGGKDRSSGALTKHESDRSMDINEAVLRNTSAAFGDDYPSDRRKTSDSEQGHSSWHSSSEWVERIPFKITKKRRSKQQKRNSSSENRSRSRKGDNKSATSTRWGRLTGESDKAQSYDSSSSLEPEILELRKVQGSLSHSGQGYMDPEAIMSEEEQSSGDEVVMHPAYQRRGSIHFAESKRKILNVLGSTKRDEVFVPAQRQEVFVPQNWASNEERRSIGPKKGGMMSIFGFSMRGDIKS